MQTPHRATIDLYMIKKKPYLQVIYLWIKLRRDYFFVGWTLFSKWKYFPQKTSHPYVQFIIELQQLYVYSFIYLK